MVTGIRRRQPTRIIRAPLNFVTIVKSKAQASNLSEAQIMDHLARNLNLEPVEIRVLPKRKGRKVKQWWDTDIRDIGRVL